MFDVPKDIANNVVLRHIWDEVHEAKKNQIILTSGLPRTGKSELDVSFSWNLYRGGGKDFEHKFEIGKHCKWSKLDYQKIVRKHKSVGACLMWDEAGIAELGAHARQFWSSSNISMSSLFQIMGFHRQISFISLPMKIMLDKHLRLLSHMHIETFKVKPKKNRCYAKVWLLEMSSRSSEVYAKYPRYIGASGLRYRIKMVTVPRAPREIREEYIAYSRVFKEWLEEKLIKDEEKRQVGKAGIDINRKLKEIIEKIKVDTEPYWDIKRNTPDVNSIMMLENIPRHQAYMVRSVLIKEGVK